METIASARIKDRAYRMSNGVGFTQDALEYTSYVFGFNYSIVGLVDGIK